MAPTFLDLCDITPSRKTDFDGQSACGLLSAKGDSWRQRVYIADHQSKTGDRRVILHPLDDTTVYMPQGEVHFVDGEAKGASPELEARARQHWEAWWKDVTSDFQPYQYAVVGTRDENPVFLQHAYTESAASEASKRYVMPVEFARDGLYFSHPPTTIPRRRRRIRRACRHPSSISSYRQCPTRRQLPHDRPATGRSEAAPRFVGWQTQRQTLRIERIDDLRGDDNRPCLSLATGSM